MSASHRAIAARFEVGLCGRLPPLCTGGCTGASSRSTYSVDTAGLDGTPAGARAVILRALRTSEAAIRRLRQARLALSRLVDAFVSEHTQTRVTRAAPQ